MVGLHIQPNREFHIWSLLFVLALIISIAICGWYGYRWYTTGEKPPVPLPAAAMAPKVDESPVTATARDSHTVPANHPRYISVPSLGIDRARVMSVDITDNGELATPANIHDAAWYNKSATPGIGYGAVMIDAHSGGATKQGIFVELASLQPGDEVIIERGDGKRFTYEIVSNRTMSLETANASGMKELMASAQPGKEGLSLITCTGNYIPQLQTYDQRVMVRGVLQSDGRAG